MEKFYTTYKCIDCGREYKNVVLQINVLENEDRNILFCIHCADFEMKNGTGVVKNNTTKGMLIPRIYYNEKRNNNL